MGVDLRQVVAGILTITMFVMLIHMIKRDHFDSVDDKLPGTTEDVNYENMKLDATHVRKNIVGLWKGDADELKPCWVKPSGDAVIVTRSLGATLVIPDIRGSQPGDKRNFEDIYDVDAFMKSMEGVVRVIKDLPAHISTQKIAAVKVPNRVTEDYIAKHVEPIYRTKGNIRLATYFPSINMRKAGKKGDTDSVACLAMYGSLELQPDMRDLVDSMVERLRTLSRNSDGQFVAVDLRVEMLDKKGCQGSDNDGEKSCFNAQEIAVFLRKLGFDKDTTVYVTQSRWDGSLDSLKDLFPKTYTKEAIMPADKKTKFLDSQDSELEKVIDFYISSESDVFVPAISGLLYANVAGKRIGSVFIIPVKERKTKKKGTASNITTKGDSVPSELPLKEVVHGGGDTSTSAFAFRPYHHSSINTTTSLGSYMEQPPLLSSLKLKLKQPHLACHASQEKNAVSLRNDALPVHGLSEMIVGVLGGDPQENCPASSLSYHHMVGSFDDSTTVEEFAKRCGVLTVEIEHVDVATLEKLENKELTANPKPLLYELFRYYLGILDKYQQKVHFSQHGIPLPEFMRIDDIEGAKKVGKLFGYPLMIKILGGFNRGLYAEKWAPFVKELTVIVVRGRDNSISCYPVVETIHRDNICHIVKAPANVKWKIRERAIEVAFNAVNFLEGAGVFAVELFLTSDVPGHIFEQIHNNLTMSNSTRCAACKSLRRKCPPDCVLAPYFPPTNPERFSCVHKVFGAGNITRMLLELGEHLRAEAADCMCFEASLRVKDPVYGVVGIISQLQQEIIQTQNDIIKIKGETAFHNAQRQRQLQDQQQMVHANDQGDLAAFSLVSSIEQQPNLSICQHHFDAPTFAVFHT
ncbi:Pre-ATP-grasp domain superfamily [Sesbania bispinosa]|nr:Pre-ATP-grasp domain superfamily [Sesbania bispinosa]